MSTGQSSSCGTAHPHATDGIWYASYPQGITLDIEPSRYHSITHFFDESVQRFADRVAYVSLGSTLTFDALRRHAHAFTSYLQQLGVQHGDRVALMMPNTLAYPVALFGALAAGAIVVNVNPLYYTVRELAHQLKDCGAQTIVVFDRFAKTVQDAQAGTRVRNVIVTGISDLLGSWLNVKGRTLDLFLRHVKKSVPRLRAARVRHAATLAMGRKAKFEPVRIGHGDIAFIQYTGKMAGVAKDAMLTSQYHRQCDAGARVGERRARQWQGNRRDAVASLSRVFATINVLMALGIGARHEPSIRAISARSRVRYTAKPSP